MENSCRFYCQRPAALWQVDWRVKALQSLLTDRIPHGRPSGKHIGSRGLPSRAQSNNGEQAMLQGCKKGGRRKSFMMAMGNCTQWNLDMLACHTAEVERGTLKSLHGITLIWTRSGFGNQE